MCRIWAQIRQFKLIMSNRRDPPYLVHLKSKFSIAAHYNGEEFGLGFAA
jgi:hypothetical protein